MDLKNMVDSKNLLRIAKKYIPGGVNSPVRAYNKVDCNPPFIEKGSGPWIYDVEGNKYLDYVLSWGPLLLGHTPPTVIEKLQEVLLAGTSFGAPVKSEIELARLLVNAVPGIDRVRLVNSGTEAVMSAVRLARASTGRDRIIKITGCYHGHSDGLLVEAGSGAAELSIPGTPGVPESFARETVAVPYNDFQAVDRVFQKYPREIAALVVEPVPANMGVVLPREGYLEFLREITAENNSLLIFDEVITGFRVTRGGAQEVFGVTPDLTCLGKIIGGGLPVGAFGGKKEIMQEIAPRGPVYQAGTLSGNPLAAAAGVETLKQLQDKKTFKKLSEKTDFLTAGMQKIADKLGINVVINHLPGLIGHFFSADKVTCYQEAVTADNQLFKQFFPGMLNGGIYLAPSPFEAIFLSLKHGRQELELTLEVYEQVLQEINQ